jgi:hypothetical protein
VSTAQPTPTSGRPSQPLGQQPPAPPPRPPAPGRVRPPRPSPVTWIFVAISGVALCVALLWTSRDRGNSVSVVIAQRDLPAFQFIRPSDLRLGFRKAEAPNRFVGLDALGRLTLRRIPRNNALTQADLAPELPHWLGAAVAVIGVPASGASVLAGRLEAGTTVQLLVPQLPTPHACIDALVLLVRREPSGSSTPYTIVVVVSERTAEQYGRLIGSTRTVVVDDPNPCPN